MAEPTKYTQVSTHDLPTPYDNNSDDAESDTGDGIVKPDIDDDTKVTKSSDDEPSDAEKEDDTGGTEHSPDAAPDGGDDTGKEKTADSAKTPAKPEDTSCKQGEDKTKENEESCCFKLMPCCPCGPCQKKAPNENTESKYKIVRWAVKKKAAAGVQMAAAKTKVASKVKPAVPVIMALIGLFLMGFDQFSDIKTGHSICNTQCKCLWSIKPNGSTSCEVPGSSQSSDAATKPCYVTFGNKEMIESFCTYAVTKEHCEHLESWAPNSTRHPKYCAASITTIIGPNIINSTYCLVSLWLLYEAVFDYLKLSCLSPNSCFRKYFKFILLVLWPLQILPYIWILFHLAICITLCRSNSKLLKKTPDLEKMDDIRDVNSNLKKWEEKSKTSKLIFTTLEDTPQLLLHSIFIINSAITEEHSLVDQGIGLLSTQTCLSLASSSASIAFCLTVFKDQTFDLGLGGKLGHMLPSLISVGTRALVCSSYAASVVEDYDLQTWTVFLPPSIAIGLSIVENFPHMVKQTNRMRKKIIKIIRSQKNPDNTEQFTNPITEDRIIKVLSFMFEAKDVWSISSSFTYLTFALALHTVWTSEFTSVKTRLVFVVIQYLALLSVIINMLMVQLEEWKESKVKWKGKILCLLYSIIFLLLSIGIYKWLNHPIYFDKYKKLYFPNVDPKTQAIKTYESFAEQFELAKTNEDVENPHWFHLANIYIIISTAGVFVFVNLLMIVISFIRYKKNPPVESSPEDGKNPHGETLPEDEKNPLGETSQEDMKNPPGESSQEKSPKDLNDIEMQEFSQQDSTSPKNIDEEEAQKTGMV